MQNQAMEITAGRAMRHRAILGEFASRDSQIAMETSIIGCRIARFCFSVTGLLLQAGTRQLVENCSAMQPYKQVGRDLFFMLEHRRFRFYPCLRIVSSLENNLLRARLRRSTAAATESTTNDSWSYQTPFFFLSDKCELTAGSDEKTQLFSASFSPLFPSKSTAVNTTAALHFLLVTMNKRSKTDEKERRRQRRRRRQEFCRESHPYFFSKNFLV